MAKHIIIDRGDGTATYVRSKIETAGEDPLTENEILINELYNKVENLGLADVSNCLDKCKEGTVVAFRSKETNEWYTGYIQGLFAPKSRFNRGNDWSLSICIIEPISPQWYNDKDKQIYYYDDIDKLTILENGL